MTKQRIADALQLVGAVSLTIAAGMVGIAWGLAAGGFLAIVAGITVAD